MRRLVLAAAFALAACAEPYDPPQVFDESFSEAGSVTNEVPSQGFAGLADLAQLNKPAGGEALPIRVMWTHGMCSPPDGTDPQNPRAWWETRTRDLLAAYPGARRTDAPAVIEKLPSGSRLIKETLSVPGRQPGTSRTIEFWFFEWSPITLPFKPRKFGDIESGKGNDYRYTRATLNASLKQGLIKDCFVDVVVYLGKNGDFIRSDAQMAVCELLDGRFDPATGCAGASDARYTALISESLGSTILFDAFRSLRLDYVVARRDAVERLLENAPETKAANRGGAVRTNKPSATARTYRANMASANATMRRANANSANVSSAMASLTSFFMLANQLPLLRFAGNRSLEEFVTGATEMRKPGEGAAALTVVAFIDPNDLLSFRLLPKSDHGRVIDFVVSNANTYFGYAELPDRAHCNYIANGYVMHAIVFGYAGGTPRSGPVDDREKCL